MKSVNAITSGMGLHLMAKPVGPSCNLRCTYCFYLEKEALFHGKKSSGRMSDEVLEAYIRQTAAADTGAPEGVIFAWQGGEPTLAGIDFFNRALEIEKKYMSGRPFQNTLQTNGTLLDDEWCVFLAKNNFLVGLSLDGPEFIHDRYRVDSAGQPTFEKVYRALNLLQKHGVEFNILACVSRESAKYPLDIYRFFKEAGIEFVQFSPLVERVADETACRLGLQLGMPPNLKDEELKDVTSWSVEPEAFGDFMIKIFEEWVRHDVGRMFVMNFEWVLSSAISGGSPVCIMSDRCGNACIVEYNGDVYSCDHFVYPEYRLGNLLTDDVSVLAGSEKQRSWGHRKYDDLPQSCRDCQVAFICRGGCPKHRFVRTSDGAPGLNYLCAGYKKFYNHTAKYVKAFQKLLEFDLPPEYIMQAIGQPVVIPASEKTGNQQVVLWIK